MFDYSMAHWATFLTAAVLLNLSPGPDIAYILATTAKRGQAAGFSAMAGIWGGALVHVVLAAAGLSVVLATSALAFSVVKWVGAAYLIYLGISALRGGGSQYLSESEESHRSNYRIFKQGILGMPY